MIADPFFQKLKNYCKNIPSWTSRGTLSPSHAILLKRLLHVRRFLKLFFCLIDIDVLVDLGKSYILIFNIF